MLEFCESSDNNAVLRNDMPIMKGVQEWLYAASAEPSWRMARSFAPFAGRQWTQPPCRRPSNNMSSRNILRNSNMSSLSILHSSNMSNRNSNILRSSNISSLNILSNSSSTPRSSNMGSSNISSNLNILSSKTNRVITPERQ